MRYQIVRNYKIAGREMQCLCTDVGPAIVHDEATAKAQVAKLHAMGYADAHYEPLPTGTAWFDDENWIG